MGSGQRNLDDPGIVNNTISFKYTVDYPKIELHPFDTKKFSILYNDTSDGLKSGID